MVACSGYEPHSALPVALPLVFCEESPLVPPALRSVKVLATSAVCAASLDLPSRGHELVVLHRDPELRRV